MAKIKIDPFITVMTFQGFLVRIFVLFYSAFGQVGFATFLL